jgi:uncharacterized protein (DUF302 family)
MTDSAEPPPSSLDPIAGVIHRRSPYSVAETVERLSEAIQTAGAKLFVLVDHSGEATRAGLSLRETKLLIFGSPTAGTPVMEAAPLSALDLPLKILVWADDAGLVWMTSLAGSWLADRYDIPADLARPLSAAEALTARLAGG